MADAHQRHNSENCTLSRSLENMVIQDSPIVDFDLANKAQWGSSALANMASILREHGYDVKELASNKNDDNRLHQAAWSETEPADQLTPPPSDPLTEANDPFSRFQILTSIMDNKRGEDGRVDASELEEALLKSDFKAFEKEGVDQLRQYLMKAREGGIPIKFDGDRSGLHQVWFKGHKDLEVALARYSQPGQNRRPPPPASSPGASRPGGTNDWNWRSRPSHHHHQQQQQQQGGHHQQQQQPQDQQLQPLTTVPFPNRTIDEMPNRYRTPSERAFDVDFLLDLLQSSGANSEQGADAKFIEEKLLEVAQSLYDIRPDVKRFSHYLMNMRAAGAPIWFSRDEEDNQPKEIFIKHTNSSIGPIRFPVPNTSWNGLQQQVSNSDLQQQENGSRFASLLEAYQYHLQQPEGFLADGQLVQSRLEAMDPTIYSRERCPSFKHLLKIAKTSGLDINWEQSELVVTTISIGL